MKTKVFFLFFFLMSAAFSVSAQKTNVGGKITMPELKYKYFADTLVIGVGNPVNVVNANDMTLTITVNGCTVLRNDGVQAFTISTTNTALIGQQIDVVVSKRSTSGNVEIIRRKARVVAASPALVNRMK